MSRTRPRPTRLRPIGVLAAALLTAAACATTEAPKSSGTQQRPCPVDQPSSATAAAAGTVSAHARLTVMADTITAIPADTRTSAAYPYSAVHTQQWSITGDTVEARDVVIWRAADGTARTQTRTLTLHRDPARFSDRAERQRLATAPAQIVDYPLANGARLDGVITEPVTHDPRALAEALAAQHGALCRRPGLFDRYLQLAGGFYLDQQARTATLRLLATIPDLAFDGIARDLIGRPGWVFVLTRPGQHTTDTIVIDPATGVLLAAATAEVDARHPRHITLYLERGRTTTRDQPPSP
ncbi:hypothetical protein [Actinoplanes philippinensis]|uniref:hypothetical protein n=1 Tax=Actinoplanes philippinensis TaxID=35752 RepID=UPI00340A9B14